MKITLSVIIIILLTSCFKGEKIDLIIHNGNIHIMNDQMDVVEAVAIHNGKIIEFGPEREILNKYRAEQEINAQQKDVYPGLHDAHGHVMSYASQKMVVDLTGTTSYYEMLLRLEKFDAHDDPEFLVGRGWDQSLWGEDELPTNSLLNERFPDKPVLLTRVDGHAAIANEVALTRAKIDENTIVPGGKVIQEKGKVTGLLLDHAIDIVSNLVPKPNREDLRKAILEIEQELLAYGITHVHEAGVNYEQLMVLDEMVSDGSLNIGMYVMLFPTPENLGFAREKGHYVNKNLSVRSFKMLMDGALGSRGACLLNHYSDMPGEFGFLLMSEAEMLSYTSEALRISYQVNAHCIGDSANRILLKHYDTLLVNEVDHRWRIEHAQVVAEEDIPLFSSSGVIPSIQPTHAVSDFRWAKERLGEQRLTSAYAYQSLLNERQMVVLGTDFPVENIDPFATIYAATARKNRENEPSSGFLKDQAMGLDDTMRGMTIWAAYGSFLEHSLGSLEKGKNATLVIFDQPVRSSQKFEPNYAFMTFIDGKVVYSME